MTDYGNACSGFDDVQMAELIGIATTYREAGGLVVKISNLLGNKVEDVLAKVPEGMRHVIDDASDLALRGAYLAASATQADEASDTYLNRALNYFRGERWHKVASGVSGAIGGAGGLATTAADLAATTTLIMRSIQQIAAGYGEDIATEEVRLQCLAVFGFGGPLTEDDDVETGLYGVRIALATGRTLEAALKLIVPRFGMMVSEKVLAQAAPILGAVAGATINPIFTAYYQDMAHVHFRLRRLEGQHDPEQVRACFERIVRSQREANAKRKRGR
ncbi:EcsC family protein [Novosphingobium bradum]|uniref:EcsC family protein n=1 Tax=Novosphingobium bradum TaxID=1737444 RepID=A0ABV7IQQ0_9SPHN